MPWTAQILSKQIDSNRRLKITVQLSDGSTQHEVAYLTEVGQSNDWLKGQINQTIANLESLKSYADNLPTGQLDLTPTPAEEPDAAEVARHQWLEKYYRLLKLEGGVESGLIPKDDVEYLALVDEVKRDYKTYADYAR